MPVQNGQNPYCRKTGICFLENKSGHVFAVFSLPDVSLDLHTCRHFFVMTVMTNLSGVHPCELSICDCMSADQLLSGRTFLFPPSPPLGGTYTGHWELIPCRRKTLRVVQCHRDLTQLTCVHLRGKRARENPNAATTRMFVGDFIL